MTKVLFTTSYFYKMDAKQWQNQTPFLPLGTIYAASLLRENNFDVSLFDVGLKDNPSEIIPVLKEKKPQFLVIYDDGFNYLSKMCLTNMRDACFEMIAYGKEHNCTVIISSSDATDQSKLYLEKGADFVIYGEGENTLLELVSFLDGGKKQEPRAKTDAVLGRYKSQEPRTKTKVLTKNIISSDSKTLREQSIDKPKIQHSTFKFQHLSEINGIIYKDSFTKKNIKTKPRKNIKSLDELSFPAWDLVDIDGYKAIWKNSKQEFALNLATTRGCPFHCNWCAKPIYGQRYNSHSPERVVEMVKYLSDNYQVNRFWMCDDIFGLKPNWVQEFRDLLQRENLKISYYIQSRADLLLKEDNIDALVASGMEEVWIGAESGSQKILDAMDKGTTIAQIEEATQLLQRKKVKVAFFIQYGYLGETKADITKTIALIKRLKPDNIGVSVSYPLPETLFYETVKDQLKNKTNWKDSDDLALLFKGTFNQDYYRKLQRYTHKEFRKTQGLSYLKKGQLAGNLRAIALLGYYIPSAFLDGITLGKMENLT
ncbi:MAG: radical SAM protein [Flavobacteriaceae bacterium]